MARKGAAAEAEAPVMPEPAPFFEPTPEPPAFTPPPAEAEPAKPTAPPEITFEFPIEPSTEGVKLPRLEDRLESLPPLEDVEEPPPGVEPPEGFFD